MKEDERRFLAAFLFTWPEGGEDLSKRDTIKLPKVGGAGLALVDRPGVAMQFGAEGLTIPRSSSRDGGGPGSQRLAKSRLGTYYAKIPFSSRSSSS